MSTFLVRAGTAALLAWSLISLPAHAQMSDGTVSVATRHSFDTLFERVEQAVSKNGLGVVAMASASRGAATRGVKIPGNAVIMVFRNDYAVRMLAASVPAGIEAPLRIYLTENRDGSATLAYRKASAVFAPYRNAEIDRLARELDELLAKIAKDAAGA
jgi:uncharacterized protein (DUF302 family)